MRLIDADELMEHVYRDKLDSRELIAEMVKNAPTIEDFRLVCEELNEGIERYRKENDRLKGEIKALAFAVRCNVVRGNEVRYEID
jgi:hypothetical protein